MKRILAPSILVGLFILFVFLMPEYNGGSSYLSVPAYLASLLRGDVYNADFVQEYVGIQGLLTHGNAYPPGPTCCSTHPPTAFLFTTPVALFPMVAASAVWAWLCLLMIGISLYVMDFPRTWIIPITLVLAFWTPVTFSLSQITPIWLLGVCLAYRERNRNPFLAGVWIGVASLTKFFPALLLAPFILRRKWSALAGFSLAWIAALATVAALSPSAITRYMAVNHFKIQDVFLVPDNASFLVSMTQMLGIPGVVGVAVIILAVFVINWRLYLQGEISRESWHFFSFLSVALLPIAWPYSLLPLLPGLIDLLLSKHASRLFALFAFILPFFLPPSAFRQIVAPTLIFVLLGFIPIHAMLNRTQAVNKGTASSADAEIAQVDVEE